MDAWYRHRKHSDESWSEWINLRNLQQPGGVRLGSLFEFTDKRPEPPFKAGLFREVSTNNGMHRVVYWTREPGIGWERITP